MLATHSCTSLPLVLCQACATLQWITTETWWSCCSMGPRAGETVTKAAIDSKLCGIHPQRREFMFLCVNGHLVRASTRTGAGQAILCIRHKFGKQLQTLEASAQNCPAKNRAEKEEMTPSDLLKRSWELWLLQKFICMIQCHKVIPQSQSHISTTCKDRAPGRKQTKKQRGGGESQHVKWRILWFQMHLLNLLSCLVLKKYIKLSIMTSYLTMK